MSQRIDLEERKLLLTQRRLEAVRMLTYLFQKMKTDEEYAEVKMLEKEIVRRRELEEILEKHLHYDQSDLHYQEKRGREKD